MLKHNGKRIAMFFLLGALTISTAVADEYLLFTESCGTFNEYTSGLNEAELKIKYDTSLENIYILQYGKLPLERMDFILSGENLADLRSACEKYFEWEELARTKGVELKKQLPIKTTVLAGWLNYSGDTLGGAGELCFGFISQSPTNHQFVIYSTKVKDIISSAYSTASRELEPLYFDKEDVQQLYNDISEESLKAAVEKVKDQQEIENMFN